MNRHYYAVISTYGFVSIFSGYGQPELHIFESKSERDEWVQEMDCKNGINNRAWEISAKDAYAAYTTGDTYNGKVLVGIEHIDGEMYCYDSNTFNRMKLTPDGWEVI